MLFTTHIDCIQTLHSCFGDKIDCNDVDHKNYNMHDHVLGKQIIKSIVLHSILTYFLHALMLAAETNSHTI